MKLVSRSGWGARSRSIPTNITPTGGVTIHYVGGPVHISSHSRCDDRVRSIQNHHIDGNGWADIAYSALVCPHGYVYVGRGPNRRTAANGTNSGNQYWYAVCALIGGSQQPTDAMVQGIKDAVAWLRAKGGAGGRVNGHRDHLSTSCPGSPLYRMVRRGVFGSGGTTSGGSSSSGGAAGMGEDMLGLTKGDKGEEVELLQLMIKRAGHGDALGKWGVDKHYGNATAEGLRRCREDAGSAAKAGYGDRVTAHALEQLYVAFARHQAREAAK